MFNAKYNLLALLQVGIGLFNFVLFIKIFGVSAVSDAYLLSIAIFTTLQLLQLLACEQVLYFYNDAKAISVEAGYLFYHSALFVGLLTGIVSLILCQLFVGGIIWVFVGDTTQLDFELLESLLLIMSFELFLYPVIYINQKILNAEMRFSLPYILNIIPITLVLFGSIYLTLSDVVNIEILAYAKLIGAGLACFLAFIAIMKCDIPIKLRIQSEYTISFIKNSFSMRFGHNVHNFLFMPITTNILSTFPQGSLSYFYYAHRIVLIIVSVAVGPSMTVFQSRMATIWSNNLFEQVRVLISKFLSIASGLMVVASVVAYLLLPHFLPLASSDMTLENIIHIQLMFLGLAVWQLIIIIESGYVTVLVTNKSSLIFLMANGLFSVMYYLLSITLTEPFGMYGIVYGLLISQIINFIIYAFFAKRVLSKKMTSQKQYCE